MGQKALAAFPVSCSSLIITATWEEEQTYAVFPTPWAWILPWAQESAGKFPYVSPWHATELRNGKASFFTFYLLMQGMF